MELFLADLVSKAVGVATQRKTKLLTSAHLKAGLAGVDTYDFLKSTLARAADLPPEEKRGGEGEEVKKRKPAAPRKPQAVGDAQAPAPKRAKALPKAGGAGKPHKPEVKFVDDEGEAEAEAEQKPGAAEDTPVTTGPPADKLPLLQAWVAPPPVVEEDDYDA
jgi:hypothetical protein